MTMQDRAYAAAIFIILGICCIGAYVAVSGFMNANPDGLSISLNDSTATPTAGVTIEIPTETAAPPTNTPLPPTQTPEGFQPTLPPAATRGPTLDFIPTIATPEFTATPEATPTLAGCGAIYCPRLGPPDARGPKGQPCSTEYIWGFVFTANGEGEPNVRLHFREANGGEGDGRSKGDPDPRGRFDFPASGGLWNVQVWDRNGDPLSPPFQVQGGIPWGGSGNCPTRVDFVQQ
jgi:hypothetical protein